MMTYKAVGIWTTTTTVILVLGQRMGMYLFMRHRITEGRCITDVYESGDSSTFKYGRTTVADWESAGWLVW